MNKKVFIIIIICLILARIGYSFTKYEKPSNNTEVESNIAEKNLGEIIEISDFKIEKHLNDSEEFISFIRKFYTNKKSNINCINTFDASNLEEKNKILKQQLASFGENNIIEVPINTNCGGKNLHIGSGVYINFGLSLVDNGNIYIGDNTFIGPNVSILTLNHAVNPNERALGGIEIKDVIIGKNVWIGAGVIIFPGVTIGDNSVIGAGSIVTKDIPSNVLAYGNPCKVIKNNSK